MLHYSIDQRLPLNPNAKIDFKPLKMMQQKHKLKEVQIDYFEGFFLVMREIVRNASEELVN